jgi:hypothetical protein
MALLAAAGAQPVRGQFFIRTPEAVSVSGNSTDSLRALGMKNNEYFSRARWEAERRRIRNQRNTLEVNPTLQVSETQFDNWAPGNQNTLTALATLYFRHQYQREGFSLDTKFESKLGINVIDKAQYKNTDEFKLNFSTKFPMRYKKKTYNNWGYTGSVNLRSQFANGFASRTDHTLKSSFMSPGFADATLGMNYTTKKFPISLTTSPFAVNCTTVTNDELSARGINGVPAGKHDKWEFGSTIRMEFDKEFCKKVFRLRSSFYGFTNYKSDPQMQFENTFEIRATKYFTTTVVGKIYYNRLSNVPRPKEMQYSFALTLGFSYKYKNK